MDRQTDVHWTDDATNTLRRFDMDYEPGSSMITNITHSTGAYRVYGYDSIDRLVSEQHFDATDTLIYSATYEYDLAGNREQTVINGVTHDYTLGTGDRLVSWGENDENTLTYDSAGNVTQIDLDGQPARDLAWDIQYRLTEVSEGGRVRRGRSPDLGIYGLGVGCVGWLHAEKSTF